MRANLKSEKGAITLVVLVAMMFLMAVLMSIYIGIANKAQISAENTKQISKQYNNIEEAETIYNSYFADTDIIPIYTREQLEKIGSGDQITINSKIYIFAENGYYALQNDLDLGGYYDADMGSWTSLTEDEWIPLTSAFTGTLDGLGNTIKGMYINNPQSTNQGLFGTLKGTVKNLRIVDSYINGLSNIGVIAGTNNGTITNCYNKDIILALSANNGKVQVDEIWYNSLQDYIKGIPAKEMEVMVGRMDMATATVIKIKFVEGMTWGEWYESKYNNGKVLKDSNGYYYVANTSENPPTSNGTNQYVTDGLKIEESPFYYTGSGSVDEPQRWYIYYM